MPPASGFQHNNWLIAGATVLWRSKSSHVHIRPLSLFGVGPLNTNAAPQGLTECTRRLPGLRNSSTWVKKASRCSCLNSHITIRKVRLLLLSLSDPSKNIIRITLSIMEGSSMTLTSSSLASISGMSINREHCGSVFHANSLSSLVTSRMLSHRVPTLLLRCLSVRYEVPRVHRHPR